MVKPLPAHALYHTTTRMLGIPASICFEGETMAAGQGRQLQIDMNYVARAMFFEL